MMKKTLIATATAGLIAAGAMVGTTSTASAAGVYFGGPGWSVGIGDGPGWRGPQRPHRVCEPVFRTVRWWDRWGRPHIQPGGRPPGVPLDLWPLERPRPESGLGPRLGPPLALKRHPLTREKPRGAQPRGFSHAIGEAVRLRRQPPPAGPDRA